MDLKLILAFLSVINCMVVANNTSDITKLKSDLKLLEAKYSRLEDGMKFSSPYCEKYVKGACGPCICKDDFNLPKKYYCDCRNQSPQRDCLAHRQNGMKIDGIYEITMNSYLNTVAFCDQTTLGGGWTVIQRRMDGSTNFFRSWNEYKVGFGELHREFWFGNDKIHYLTAQAILPKGSEALIQVKFLHTSFKHNTIYNNRYSHFHIDNEKHAYELHVTGPSGGYGSNYFTNYQNNQKFSTWDRDNDQSSTYNCAYSYQKAGWWINGDTNSCKTHREYNSINSPYDAANTQALHHRIDWHSLKVSFTAMKVRRLQ
ncbi:fibroleukin-like [Clytia hemisphaerica]|uniref:Fibrinogen C-terminal domain-containing protein n=1 Tax=Clytia hemisphaerica TaxID=252671 RepID=A0A7M5V7R0_9CNID